MYLTTDLRRVWGWDKTAQAPTASSYQANSLNQYATVNAAALIYDLDGNLTEDANKSYTYDGENRLLSVTPKVPGEGDGKATFAYDYMGRRVKKESYVWQTIAWVKIDETRYLYDGWNMIREFDAGGATKRSFVWGIDLSREKNCPLRKEGKRRGPMKKERVLPLKLLDGSIQNWFQG